MDIEENIKAVREKINATAAASGRDPEDILLIGASKMNDADTVRHAIASGLTACGENRVQELQEKEAQNAYEGAQLHFIGHLQRNKVKNVVGHVCLIHSVHSRELIEEIDRCAGKRDIVQDILLEINIANEESKSGFHADETAQVLEFCGNFSHVRVRGLMAIPPVCLSGEDNRPYFQSMYKLFVDNCEKKYDNVVMDFLSMGMSGDYETAIACGANMVRLGTAIFGERHYPAALH